MLYFVNSRLALVLDNHRQCVIFLRYYQHILDCVVVVVHDLQENAKLSLELTILLSKNCPGIFKMLTGKRNPAH